MNHTKRKTDHSLFQRARENDFHLSKEQIQFFDENGYLILRKWIQGKMLKDLQEAGDRMIARGQKLSESDEFKSAGNGADYAFAKRDTGKSVFFRINYLYDKGEPTMLSLLGSPQLLEVAESLNGQDFVPTYESMVFKMEGDGEAIRWHQDAWQKRNHRVWNFDLYLDESTEQNGCLRVIPGSQKKQHDACEVAQKYGWEHPDITLVEMQPGDVLIHDDMVLHGSPRVTSTTHKRRRTLYFEFRNVQQILEEGPWDRKFIEQRLDLVPAAMEQHQILYPESHKFQWNISDQYRPKAKTLDETLMRILHEKHSPGAYCSADSLPEGHGSDSDS